jgi:hypothetical protein
MKGFINLINPFGGFVILRLLFWVICYQDQVCHEIDNISFSLFYIAYEKNEIEKLFICYMKNNVRLLFKIYLWGYHVKIDAVVRTYFTNLCNYNIYSDLEN